MIEHEIARGTATIISMRMLTRARRIESGLVAIRIVLLWLPRNKEQEGAEEIVAVTVTTINITIVDADTL